MVEILLYGKSLRNIQAPTKRRISWYERQHCRVTQTHKNQGSPKSAVGGRVGMKGTIELQAQRLK